MKTIYEDINSIDIEIELIKSQMKKETQFKHNLEMNIEIRKLWKN